MCCVGHKVLLGFPVRCYYNPGWGEDLSAAPTASTTIYPIQILYFSLDDRAVKKKKINKNLEKSLAWNACFHFACDCKGIPKIAIGSYHSQPSKVSRGITCPFSQYVLLKWERGGERAANPSVQFSFKISFTNEPDTTSIRSLILTSTARCK